MESNNNDFKALNIIFFALLAGQLLFAIVVVYLNGQQEAETSYLLGPETDPMAVGAYVLAMVFFSRFIDSMWKKQISTVLRVQRPAFAHYRTNVIIRLAILEGASLLTIVFAMVTNNSTLFLCTAFVLAAFWMARPTVEEFTERYDAR